MTPAEERARTRADLERTLAAAVRMGGEDAPGTAEIRRRLGCIAWLEARGDGRPLDAGTLREYEAAGRHAQ